MSNLEPKSLSLEEVQAMIPRKTIVHTFRNSGQVMLGADFTRDRIIELAQEFGAELSGENARSLNHAVCIKDEHGYLFIETLAQNNPT